LYFLVAVMRWTRTLLLILLCASPVFAEDWPQWLGPRRDASSQSKIAPWKQAPEVVWRKPVGEGHSSPVVAAGKVFLHTKLADKDDEEVTCYDAKSGDVVWRKTYERAAFKSPFGNGPRATPAVSGGKLYTFGITGVLSCFDVKDGTRLWHKDTLKEFEAANLFFGASCSPIVHGNKVLVNVGGKGASVVAFSRSDGKVVWKSQDDKASYSSPIAFVKGQEPQVVFLTQAGLLALHPDYGALAWRWPFKDALLESSTTPVLQDDLLVASSITLGSIALRLGKDGRPEKEPVWKKRELTCYFATPVFAGKHLYMVIGQIPNPLAPKKKPQASLRCVDPADGKELWRRDKVGTYHASLIRTGDDKLLMLEEGGSLVLIDPDPKEYRELVRARVCGQTWAHAALSDNRLYVRDGRELICVQLKQ
jgi:outer membrane protein assembly factor BamB